MSQEYDYGAHSLLLLKKIPVSVLRAGEKIITASFVIILILSFAPAIAGIKAEDSSSRIDNLADSIYASLNNGDNRTALFLSGKLDNLLSTMNNIDQLNLSRPFYLIGISYYQNGFYLKSIDYYEKALNSLEKYPDRILYGRTCYNMATAYFAIGDDIRSEKYFLLSAEVVKEQKGAMTPELAIDYNALLSNSINIRNYKRALEYAINGINIVKRNPDSVKAGIKALLYQNKAIAMSRMEDYLQAVLNCEEALRICRENSLAVDEYYINLMGVLALSYYNLGNTKKAGEIYESGIKQFGERNDYTTSNFKVNYAKFLAANQMVPKAAVVYSDLVSGLRVKSSAGSRESTQIFLDYADFLRSYNIDIDHSLELLKECQRYSAENPWDRRLNSPISLSYALTLLGKNQEAAALDSINALLWREIPGAENPGSMDNPDVNLLRSDISTLDILFAKARILRQINSKKAGSETLKAEVETSELIISVIENIRINLGEDQSRILLGDKFRNAYIDVILSLVSLYEHEKDNKWIELAFEYSEKGKAASLLASMRERKARLDLIPADLILAEKMMQEESGFYAAKLEEEQSRQNPDPELITLWQKSLLQSTVKKDSLERIFEENYHGYYDLKSDVRVINYVNIRKYAGRNSNFISYVVSDTMLYIFLANRNGIWLEKVKTGKDFALSITKFRSLLSGPEHNEGSAEQFRDFQKYGYLLYSYLISPVSGRFVSDELVISPDYMLSFFPFETLVTDNEIHTDRLYSKLPYLMNDFEISYSYSATLLSESGKTRATLKNKLLAFAPSYDTIYIDSVSVWRQNIGETLTSLKYSGEEASFVSRITGGDAFIGKEATRLRFIAESGNFNILHLAMHTVLKSKDPVNSGLIFFKEGDSISNILTPYDIYSLPLNAKMVVLSSCYTGSGTLYSGEGVLSLARGFIFSGSRSVMMSLWEVDDRSGMEIIKSYYRKLKKGIGKSRALKEARMEYLNNADMAAAHPYYWSTLVIYGDDSPLYISRITRILLILIPLLLAFNVWSYLRKR